MNWRQKLFRLWIVGAALFVITVAFIGYRDIKEQREFGTMVPQLCGKARGVAGEDYSTIEHRNSPNVTPNPQQVCWYTTSKFRTLYPEYNDLSNDQLTNTFHVYYGIAAPRELNPWATLGMWAGIALGSPLAVLVLGASLVWAFGKPKQVDRPN
jgi:hypothetical protein